VRTIVRRRSPFRPSFGTNPPLVAGRDDIIDEVADALDDGPGAAGRACLFTGNRGIGKTVMLNEVEVVARERGWLVISETATPGLVDRLTTEGLPALATLLTQERPRRRISGVSLPANLGGLEFDLPDGAGPGGLRHQVTALANALQEHGTGLLITVDEVHARAARGDVEQLAAVVQHAFREDLDVAFAAAGLPAAVQDLLSADVSTFLRRARRFVLAPLAPVAVEEALRVPIVQAGRTISADALGAAAQATFGYPYLVQVMGDQIWRQRPDHLEISMDDVTAGIRDGVRQAAASLHEPAINDLSDADREFVKAMVVDDGESAIADIERRLGRTHSWVSRYRGRLLVSGVVEPSRRGYLRFTIPYMREFLADRPDRY